MEDNHLVNVPMRSSPLITSPSTPLPLSGSINGDTIQVQGDTGNLQFSLQFSIRHTHTSENHFHFPDMNTQENQTLLNSSASSYVTPTTTHKNEDQDEYVDVSTVHGNTDGVCLTPVKEKAPDKKTGAIVTRLQSGVLSPITYRPQRSAVLNGQIGSSRRRKAKKRNEGTRDVLETILRRRSCRPIRPCNSYSLFVMASWDTVKCCSFGATSKRLGEMWCKLSCDEKKVYEDLALKDISRYKRQCMLLKDHVHEDLNSG